MFAPNIDIEIDLTAQREKLWLHLQQHRQRWAAACIHAMQLKQRVLGVDLLLQAFFDMVVNTIVHRRWDLCCDWIDTQEFYVSDNATAHQLLIIAMQQLEQECEALLPDFSPILGEIRIQCLRLKKILLKDVAIPWRRLEEETHDPIDVSLDYVLASIDAKDPATGEHSRAVSAWCTRISRKLGLSMDMTIKVKRGGLVHDLGKTTTPLDILTAPRRLTPDEWLIMQHHVVAGWQMIQELPALQEFSAIVRSHHERYQGGGYPDSLEGTSIPLSTRIVTVADSFNAMIGRRPYRTPMTPMAAIQELRRHRSSQFDPDVTDAMTEVIYEMVGQGGFAIPDGWNWQCPTGLIED